MVFVSQSYAIMIYWLPLCDLIGNFPQLSVYNFLIGALSIWTSFVEAIAGTGEGLGGVLGGEHGRGKSDALMTLSHVAFDYFF